MVSALHHERSKVIVRKLPPSLSAEDFKAAVDADFNGQYIWFYYVPGKVSAKTVKHSRAYLSFQDPSHVYDFRSKLHGHTFVSEKGAQFSCTVEYAPYQKVPKRPKKQDSKEGTLEKDADYEEFLRALENNSAPLKPVNEVGAPPVDTSKRITPLMQYLHDKWTGKLVPAINKPRPRKQRAELDSLAPPPGFQPLPKASDRSQKAASKPGSQEGGGSRSKARLEAAQEAVAAALKGVEKSETSGTASVSGSKQRPLKKKLGSAPHAEEASGSPRLKAAPSSGPRKILKNPAKEAAKPAQQEQGSKQADTPSAEEVVTKKAAPRPVRVRAGFQLYTPKVRSGDAETRPTASTPHSNGSPTAGSSRGENGAANGSTGRQMTGGLANEGDYKITGGWETSDQPSSSRQERHGRQKSLTQGNNHQAFWTALHGNGNTAAAAPGDTWDTPADGPEWVFEAESPPESSSWGERPSRDNEPQPIKHSSGSGGRRNWRGKAEPSG